MRGHDRLQREEVERRGARCIARYERFGGRVGEGQIGDTAAVVEAVDRAACDAGQIGDGYHGRALLVGEDNGDIGEKPARYAGGPSVELACLQRDAWRSEEHTSELQSLMRISYAVFCLKTQ